MAGLTALLALRKGGLLLGRKVLVDGATGGAGHLAIQLAAASGAYVYAHIRRTESAADVAKWATGGVVCGPTVDAARAFGPFDLIIDSVGGSALGMLRADGMCVTFGASGGSDVAFDSQAFFRVAGAKLHGVYLFEDLAKSEPAGMGLALLAHLVDDGRLKPKVGVDASWQEIADVARRLLDRDFNGKAVLRLS